jgi:hypothetical protein
MQAEDMVPENDPVLKIEGVEVLLKEGDLLIAMGLPNQPVTRSRAAAMQPPQHERVALKVLLVAPTVVTIVITELWRLRLISSQRKYVLCQICSKRPGTS